MQQNSSFAQYGLVLAIYAVLVLMPPTSLAQEQPASKTNSNKPVQKLRGVVVSASRSEEDVVESSKSVDWVNQESIKRVQSRSIAESVTALPNVEVEGGSRPLSQEINIRGIGGNRIVRLIDGTRQNFSAGHRGSYYLDPALLKGVEVVRGASSSAWGSGSIGGVVNMVTKDASDFLQSDEAFGAELAYDVGSAADEKVLNASLFGQLNSGDQYLFSIVDREADDIELGNGNTLPNSAIESQSLLAKYRWQLTEQQHLSFSFSNLDADQQVPSNPSTNASPGPSSSNPLLQRNTEQSNLKLAYGYSDDDNPWLDFSANVYKNTTDIEENCLGACGLRLGGPARRDTSEYTTQGISLQNTSGSETVKFVYGLDYYKDEINSSRNGQPREQYPTSESELTAAFVRAEIAITNAFYVIPSIRYDQFDHSAADLSLAEVEESERSESLALRWQAASWFALIASYDEAFRAPGLTELFPTGVHFDLFSEGAVNPANTPFPGVPASPALSNLFVPNLDLKPERAENKELSARFKFKGLAGNDELRIRLTAFQNDVDDFINQVVSVDIAHYMNAYFSTAFNPFVSFEDVFDQGRVSTQNRNVSSAEFDGYELDVAYEINNTSVALSYGETDAKDKDTGDALSVPADKWVLDIAQNFLQGDLAAGLRVTDAGDREPAVSGLPPVEGYTVTDAYFVWEPSSESLAGLRLGLSVLNLGDKDYQRNSFDLPSAGRDVRLTARYRF